MADNTKTQGEVTMVSTAFFDGQMAVAERNIKRLWIALIVAIVLIFATNMIWLYEWMAYDYVSTETVTIDGADGIANYIGNDGDIYNGENSNPAHALAHENGQ